MAGHSSSMPTRIPFRTLPKLSGALMGGIALALLVGVAAAVMTLLGGKEGAGRFAQAFHFNWIFWSGMVAIVVASMYFGPRGAPAKEKAPDNGPMA